MQIFKLTFTTINKEGKKLKQVLKRVNTKGKVSSTMIACRFYAQHQIANPQLKILSISCKPWPKNEDVEE